MTEDTALTRKMEDKAAAVSPGWRTSSYSGNGGDTCVEAGSVPGAVLVRDTTNRAGAVLGIAPSAWTAFLATIR